MKYASTLALHEVPNGLSADWQTVFGDLTALLHTVRCYLFDPGLAFGTEETLHNACKSMDKSKKQLNEAVVRLYGIAPKTFDVGCGIKKATLPIAGQFGNYRLWRVPPELSKPDPSKPKRFKYPDRSPFFRFIRDLHEERKTFPERQLLLELHEAISAEKGINLATGKKAGRKPNEKKPQIIRRVQELITQGEKWRNIYTRVNAEFGTDYTYSRSGMLQKMLLEANTSNQLRI